MLDETIQEIIMTEQSALAAVQQVKVRLSQEKKSYQDNAYSQVKEANKQANIILQQRIALLHTQKDQLQEQRLHDAMFEQRKLFATYESAVGMAARAAVQVVVKAGFV